MCIGGNFNSCVLKLVEPNGTWRWLNEHIHATIPKARARMVSLYDQVLPDCLDRVILNQSTLFQYVQERVRTCCHDK